MSLRTAYGCAINPGGRQRLASGRHAANRLHSAAESLSMIINRLGGIPAKAARIRSAMRLVLTPTTYPTKVGIIADKEKYASVRFSEYGGINDIEIVIQTRQIDAA